MGSLEKILDMVPGINKLRQLKDVPKPMKEEN
jgi:signal recognition particle subunit SRP54